MADTRADILRAALSLFTSRGYDATSMRAVAREADVDPSLPRHYFASKSSLFIESLGPLDQIPVRVPRVLDAPPGLMGVRLVESFLELWDSPVMGPRLMTILTSAAASPEVATVVRNLLLTQLFVPVASAAGAEDVDGRAAAAASQMIGLAMSRYVLRLEPLASAPAGQIVERFGPIMQTLLSSSTR